MHTLHGIILMSIGSPVQQVCNWEYMLVSKNQRYTQSPHIIFNIIKIDRQKLADYNEISLFEYIQDMFWNACLIIGIYPLVYDL